MPLPDGPDGPEGPAGDQHEASDSFSHKAMNLLPEAAMHTTKEWRCTPTTLLQYNDAHQELCITEDTRNSRITATTLIAAWSQNVADNASVGSHTHQQPAA